MTQLIKSPFFESNFETFDLLWKNLFHNDGRFSSVVDSKINYPVDIAESEDGLIIEIAIVGRDKKDININIEEDILNVSTEHIPIKKREAYSRIHYNGIKRSDVSLSWKVSDKYDLAKTEASYNNGLLRLEIPFSEEKKKLTREIKIK